MTNEEAMEFLDCIIRPIMNEDYYDVDECVDLAIEALEKKMPKKPILEVISKYKNGNVKKSDYKCPNCLRVGYLHRSDALDVCCGFCGQLIDWSDE